MRRGLLAAAAFAAAAARPHQSADVATTDKRVGGSAWIADKAFAGGAVVDDARAARLLASTQLRSALEGCRLRPGAAHSALFSQEACFLLGGKDGARLPQLSKEVIRPRAPLHVAVRGPAAPDAPAATVRIAVHDGAVSVIAKPRHGAAASSAHVRAIVSEAIKGDSKGSLVTLPHIAGAPSQEWELIVRAVPEQQGMRSSSRLHMKEDGDAEAHGPIAAEEDADGAAIVSLTYAAAAEDARMHSANDAAPRLLGPANAPTVLADGQPVADRVGRSRWQYYNFLQAAPLPGRVDIVVTPISGDPDMYVTLNGQTPTRSTYQYASTSWQGADAVVIRTNDTAVNRFCSGTGPSGSVCNITIGVYGWGASNFTITATSEAGAAALTPGLPFFDELLTGGTYNYYSLAATVDESRVTIAVTPLSGDPDILVSNTAYIALGTGGSARPTIGATTSYCAFSNSNRRDVVEIYPSDPCYCVAPCTYYIGVLAWGGATQYSIVATEAANPIITLIDGLPMAGVLPQGETDQFVFNVQFTDEDPTLPPHRRVVEILTQSYLGDVDLFVTMDPSRLPGPSTWDYRAIGSGGIDAIAIRPTDPQFANSACGPAIAAGGACTIAIATYGFSTSIYAIVATAGRYVQLADGQPQADAVDAGTYNFYRFSVLEPNQLVTITLQPSSGDPDIYVGSDANANTTVPTSARGTYIWRSITMGREIVQIHPADPGACAAPCSYYIGVLGYRSNASYVITAASGSAEPTKLILGVPQADAVADRAYARYTAEFNASTLTVTVAPSSGDPDLAVSLGPNNPLVTLANAQYVSAAATGPDAVTIRPTDAAYIANCSAPSTWAGGVPGSCTANIAVFGWGPSAYTITASVDASVLFDGVPAYGSVGAGKYAYFSYVATSAAPVAISVTPIAGDPDLFASVTSPRPNSTNRQWWSNGMGSETITIDFSDPRAAGCAIPCTIYVAVLGWFAPASFVITASASPLTSLIPGIQQSGHALAWAWQYYTLQVPAPAAGAAPVAIEFAATPISGGDISIYVNNVVDATSGDIALPVTSCPPATCFNWVVNNAVWSSFGSPTRERIVISPSDPGYAPGTYVVGVLALGADADFSVTGVMAGGIVTLTPGIPFEDSATAGTYNYYRLILDKYGHDVSISVTPLNGDPDLYVSFHYANLYPNRTNSDRSSVSARNMDSVYLPWRVLAECQAQIAPDGTGGDCDISIGVYGFTNTTYTVTATPVNGTIRTLLLDGVPANGVVGWKQYQYFYVPVQVPRGTTYSVYVRSIAGDADLYVRLDGQNPTSNFYQFASTRMSGDDYINIAPASRFYNSTAMLVAAVYGFTPNVTFQIVYASSVAVVQLANGIAQTSSVARGSYAYFYVAVPSPGTDVTFALTALSGDPDIYVDVWKSPTYRPSETSWKWEGSYFGSDTVTISGLNDPYACGACNYIAAVACAVGTTCRFTLTATVSPFTLIPLEDGEPLSSAAATGTSKFFSFDTGADPTTVNVTFSVVSLTGSAQLYITNLYVPGEGGIGSLPSSAAGNYVWSTASGGNTTGSGVVTIAFNDPAIPAGAGNPYSIAAYCAIGPCTFTVVAATAAMPITLVPGQPSQDLTLSPGANQLFNLAVPDTTLDLVVVATVLDGGVVVAASLRGAPYCWQNATGAVLCNATWAGYAAGTPSQLRISAASPCSGPYVVGPCDPAADWTAGQYQVTAFSPSYAGAGAASYSLTAYESNAVLRLVDGQPQGGQTAVSQPAIYTFQTDYDLSLPDLRVSLIADVTPLVIYITSCYETQCTPATSVPGPTNYEAVATIDASTAQDVFITKYMRAYCTDPSGGGTCDYFVAVYPATSCDVPACTARFTVVAQEQGGGVTAITYFSVNGRMLTQPGSIPPGRTATYELYLQPSNPLDVTMRVDACGPGFPSLYTCDPSAGAAKKCGNPFQPGKADNSAAASTAGAAALGSATITTAGVTASNFFAAVAADTASASDADAVVPMVPAFGQSAPETWGYALMLSVGPTVALWAPSPSTLAVESVGTSVKVSWAAPVIGSATQPGTRVARGVTYVVYAAPGGFAQSAAGLTATVVPTTACGLIRWASITGGVPGIEPPTSVTDALSATVNNLDPQMSYEINVMAVCDRACWLANSRLVAEEEEAAAAIQAGAAVSPVDKMVASALRSLTASAGSAPAAGTGTGLGAPGYDIQRIAYTVAAVNTGASTNPPTKEGFPPAGVAGIVIGSLAVVAAAGCYIRIRRRRVAAAQGQYSRFDNIGGMDTISTPASTYVRSSGGIMASIRSVLSRPGGGGGSGAGSINNPAYGVRPTGALADSSYSELDDRASAYL